MPQNRSGLKNSKPSSLDGKDLKSVRTFKQRAIATGPDVPDLASDSLLSH